MADEPTAILDHVAPALLVIFRISGLMLYGPIFGSRVVPPRLRVGLAVLLGLAAYPLVTTGLDPSLVGRLQLWELPPLIVFELVIGLLIGLMASLPLVAVQFGGLIMGQQMGLGFAQFYSPTLEDEADVLGQVLFFAVLAGFLAVGGHEAMLLAVLHSFEHLPPPAVVAAPVDGHLVLLLGGMMNAVIELALRVAAPLLAVIFVETVALGFVAKTAPQINILSLGFPVRVILGLAITLVGLTVINEVFMVQVNSVLELIFTWIEGP